MKLVLLRHGESVWNKENKFTGWTDVELSEKGVLEAKSAGELLKTHNFHFDLAYTSVLKRAIDTLKYVLETMEINIPVIKDYHLNERHYGALQGLNKDEAKIKYGEHQVMLWRRGVHEEIPKLTKDDSRYPGNDLKYKDLSVDELPLSENLNDTIERVSKYFKEEIALKLLENKDILVVAHGNSLRALIKYIENLSDEEVINLEIATGTIYVYEFDDKLNILNKYFLKSENA